MSQSLRSLSTLDRNKAIIRRLQGDKRGLGYWSAIDAGNKILKGRKIV